MATLAQAQTLHTEASTDANHRPQYVVHSYERYFQKSAYQIGLERILQFGLVHYNLPPLAHKPYVPIGAEKLHHPMDVCQNHQVLHLQRWHYWQHRYHEHISSCHW